MVWYRTGLENVGRVHIADLSAAIDSSYSPSINSVTCQWMADSRLPIRDPFRLGSDGRDEAIVY